jgi:hypothetical protein
VDGALLDRASRARCPVCRSFVWYAPTHANARLHGKCFAVTGGRWGPAYEAAVVSGRFVHVPPAEGAGGAPGAAGGAGYPALLGGEPEGPEGEVEEEAAAGEGGGAAGSAEQDPAAGGAAGGGGAGHEEGWRQGGDAPGESGAGSDAGTPNDAAARGGEEGWGGAAGGEGGPAE